MAQRRHHAAVQVLGVGETAERASLPFGQIDPPRCLERAFVLAATGRQLGAGEMEVAAKIVENLGQRAIVEVCEAASGSASASAENASSRRAMRRLAAARPTSPRRLSAAATLAASALS